MLDIRPGDPAHATLEQDVIGLFEERGFLTSEATYHSVMPKLVVDVLKNLWDPTALYLRGRADRIAVRKTPPLALQWEAKTHKSRRLHDLTVEALPVCVHLALSRLDIKCLYIYRDEERGYDVGFWVDAMPKPRIIMVPRRWNNDEKNDLWFDVCVGRIEPFFPETDIISTRRGRGSGDPFAIVDEKDVKPLLCWREIIDSL